MLTVACIPAYNVEKTIVDVIKRSLNFVDKVIVCDDGSSDSTSKNAEFAGAVLIKHEKNLLSLNSTAGINLFSYGTIIFHR